MITLTIYLLIKNRRLKQSLVIYKNVLHETCQDLSKMEIKYMAALSLANDFRKQIFDMGGCVSIDETLYNKADKLGDAVFTAKQSEN